MKTLLLALLATFSLAAAGRAELAPSKPHIILVITDDQGYPPVGRHGHPWLKTPHLDALYDEGLALVILSSDQGFNLGEHDWFDKRLIYEESLTTPLLVRWPGVTKPATSSKSLVSILDFPEAFLDAAGVPVPADMGKAMLTLLGQ